jgi:hypothetical protein
MEVSMKPTAHGIRTDAAGSSDVTEGLNGRPSQGSPLLDHHRLREAPIDWFLDGAKFTPGDRPAGALVPQ